MFRKRLAPLADEALETMSVELIGVRAQHIAAVRGLDRAGAQCLPKTGDVSLDSGARLPGRVLRPELFDQLVLRDRVIPIQQKEGENGALLQLAERKRLIAAADLNLPKDA